MPRDARTDRNKPPLIDDFAVQRAHGADLALLFHRMVEIEGTMPDGGRNRVKLAFASVPALLAMKGFAINDRLKQKDAYDIYYCVRNHIGWYLRKSQNRLQSELESSFLAVSFRMGPSRIARQIIHQVP